jgi:hypothetical protein
MLQHDGHLFRILLAQAIGETHAAVAGPERDVEMVIARQTEAADVGQHATNDAAQRLLHHQVVADEISRHRGPAGSDSRQG